MPAVAGARAPGRGKAVEGLRKWLGDKITAVSCCRVYGSVKDNPKWWKSCRHTRYGLTRDYLFNSYK